MRQIAATFADVGRPVGFGEAAALSSTSMIDRCDRVGQSETTPCRCQNIRRQPPAVVAADVVGQFACDDKGANNPSTGGRHCE